jgi:hypothetical protein
MRSKEAFAYLRSTGYFCSVATDHDATGVELRSLSPSTIVRAARAAATPRVSLAARPEKREY